MMRRFIALCLALSLSGCAQPLELNSDTAREIILDSYQEFETKGLTEELTNSEGDWVMVYDPSRPEYQAAWFSESTTQSELIMESDYFSVYVAYIMLDDRELEIEVAGDQILISSKNWSPMKLTIRNGLIVGASSNSHSPWSSVIRYQVSGENREKLKTLESELVQSDGLTS
jgi:outer membrane lipoprotein-sorting protein